MRSYIVAEFWTGGAAPCMYDKYDNVWLVLFHLNKLSASPSLTYLGTLADHTVQLLLVIYLAFICLVAIK